MKRTFVIYKLKRNEGFYILFLVLKGFSLYTCSGPFLQCLMELKTPLLA